MIDASRAEAAVEFLRDSAKEYGQMRGYMAYCEGNLRRVKSLELLASEGSLGEREAKAYASDKYMKALEELRNATADYETSRARREAADLTIQVWRSQNATRRQGDV